MTFAPTKKTSKTRTGKRSGQWRRLTARKLLERTSLQYDSEGNALGLSHFASAITGEYRGRRVYDPAKKRRGPDRTIRA